MLMIRVRHQHLLAIPTLLFAAFLWKPVTVLDGLRKVSLMIHGVRRVHVGALAAYEENLCAPGAPCRCVALIHGLGDSALTWDNILLGDHGAAKPPKGVDLVAIEIPGSEGSAPPSSYAVPVMASAIKDSLASKCSEWTVAGNSLGGWLAAELALQWPAGVKRLILLNAAGIDDPTGDLEKAARTLESPTVENLRDFVARCYAKPPPANARALAEIAASILSRPAAKIVAALKREDQLDARASHIKAATTIIWGASDRVVPRAVGEAYARLIPGARLELVPDCGHLPQQECPQAVSRELFPGR